MTSDVGRKTLAILQNLLEQDSSAEKTFEEKYKNEFYKITESEEDPGRIIHLKILERFGKNIPSISIESIELIEGDDEECCWLLKSLIQYCATLKRLKLAYLEVDLAKLLSNLPNLTHCTLMNLDINGDDWTQVQLPHLKHLKMEGDIRLESDKLSKFIENNSQIESLQLNTYFNPIELINGKLKVLKQLKLEGRDSFASDRIGGDAIKLDSLESLNVNCIDIIPVLQMFRNGCNRINELFVTLTLNILVEVSVDEDALMTVISSFEHITKLSVENVKFTGNQLEQFGKNLQKLSSLTVEMKITENISSQILHVLPFFSSLTAFRVKLDVGMLNDLNYEFHQRFLEATSKNLDDLKLIFIFQNNEELTFSKEKIIHGKDGSSPVLIHWVGYEAATSLSRVNILDFNELSLNHLLNHMDLMSLIALKQTCQKLRLKIIRYARDTFRTRSFTFNAGTNVHELRKIFQVLGQYFHKLEIVVPGICESTEIFGLVNRFCKILVEISISSQSYTNGLINPVKFELLQLRKLTYKNFTDIDLEISGFAGCPLLQHLELISTGSFGPLDDKLDILRQNNSFINLVGIKMHLSLGTTINLLKSLSANVANRLQELWITTPVYLVENDEEKLADVIGRYHNLTKLHLIVPNNYMNSDVLFAHCAGVTDLSILDDAQNDSTKSTLKHVQTYCKFLRTLNIYHYESSIPVEVLRVASALFPNTKIESVQICEDGTQIVDDSITTEGLVSCG